MTDTGKFWDKHAEGYAKRKISNEEAYRRKLKETQAFLTPESRVFEFACGTGTTALHHAPFAKQIDAIDISPKMLEIARAKAEVDKVRNIAFSLGDIETFDSPPERYDVVMGHSILHLVDDKEKIIRKVFEMLKPGGVFVSSTACLKGVMPWLRLVLPLGATFGLLPRIQFFTGEELMQTMVQNGFQIENNWQPSKTQGVFVIARKN